jgi:hypothetical protein
MKEDEYKTKIISRIFFGSLFIGICSYYFIRTYQINEKKKLINWIDTTIEEEIERYHKIKMEKKK